MCVVAKDREMLSELLECGHEVMYIDDGTIVFYPDQTQIILNSSEVDKIRGLCNRDIIDISGNGLAFRMFANIEPDSVLFLGAKCNSNCIMCPASDAERRNGFSYTPEQIYSYINYLPCDLESLVVTGGEPTMNPDLLLFAMRKIKEKYQYTQVLLLTNGRALSNSGFVTELCSAAPSNLVIAIPVHGDNAKLHDSITRVDGSFYETQLAIHRLLAKKIPVELRIVVNEVNSNHLHGIARLVTSELQTINVVNFVGLEPRGNCAINAERVYIEHKDGFIRMKPAINHLVEHGINVGIYNYPLCSVDQGYWSICKKSISQYKAIYHEKCNECIVKDLCGGLFVATMAFIKPDVSPIVKKENSCA